MTSEQLKKATEILRKIEHIEQLKSWTFDNPMIKKNGDGCKYIYLSWADNENKELQNIIINWCKEEIKRLQEEFNNL